MGGAEQQNTRADIAPDWALWLDLLAINVSQAAALSLNLDPASTDKVPSLVLRQELQRRALVIENHANNGGFKITGRDFDRRAIARQPRLPLHDFVLWALARSWALPEPLAQRFEPSPAPALPEVPAMLSPDLLSVDEWAHRLACAECPMPSEPETEAKRTIDAVIAWRADGPTQGLFRLRPKPGSVWATLQDVTDWEEAPITDPVEVRGYSGYVSQATTGYPPYPEPPLILAGELQVFKVKTKLPPEWDDYNDASSAYGITRLWWEDQLVKAVNAEALKACDASKALIKRQTVPPSRAYIKSDHLAAWIAEHQPFKDVGAAFSDSTQAEAKASPAIPSQPGTPALNIPKGLPTSTIIRLFSSQDVGKMGDSDWRAAFNTPPDWLRKAKRQDGTKGNNSREALWCPLEIAKALVWGPGPQKRRRLTYLQAHRVFEKSDELAPYLDAWLNLAPQREAA